MSEQASVLALAGSARQDSFNKRLLKIAAAGAESGDAKVTFVDLAELNLPLFNQDELAADGFPDGAVRLKELLKANDGLLIASPEYNSSVSAPLKNAIDWASRTMGDEKWKECFVGKTAAIMCATTGSSGLKGLLHLRDILSAMHVLTLPEQVIVPKAAAAFDLDTLLDEDLHSRAHELGKKLASTVRSLNKNK